MRQVALLVLAEPELLQAAVEEVVAPQELPQSELAEAVVEASLHPRCLEEVAEEE